MTYYLIRTAFWIAMIGLVLSNFSAVHAADHLDAPVLQQAGAGDRDINDLYAFQSPTNANNTVLILTTNPFAGQLSGLTFGDDVQYQFQIDNNNDQVADVTYSTTFTAAVNGSQTLTTLRNGSPFAAGTTDANVATTGGGTLRAGLFEDPFFFDLAGFQNGFNFTGADAFAGADVSAIVLEVPSSDLGAQNVGIWARTVVGGNQVDRIGRPAINTALIPSGRKDEFNQASPANDFANFNVDMQAIIESLNGGDATNAMGTTALLLPDVLTFDTNSTGGFLNGRRLDDDVIDIELGVLTKNALTSDMVDNNDVAFPNVFPFLAAANIPEPSSLLLIVMGTLATGVLRIRRGDRRA